MTNDEVRMTKQIRMTGYERRQSFVIRMQLARRGGPLIRHSGFVIP
jgi:hypothetical protein